MDTVNNTLYHHVSVHKGPQLLLACMQFEHIFVKKKINEYIFLNLCLLTVKRSKTKFRLFKIK